MKALESWPVRPGDVLLGKYRVERVLGSGGTGVVVAAVHTELEQPVAIKLLRAKLAAHPQLGERFLREARAAASLRSEHCVRVFDVGLLDAPPREPGPVLRLPYIVMEYLEGADLRARLSCGPLPIEEATGILREACEAVGEAHERGLVHRDLKPDNLFLATTGDGARRVKVLDFGISKKVYREDEPRLTAESSFLGTPLYMAPEQMRSARNADPRSDVWSLGAVLYELLTGRTPFSGATLVETCARVTTESPVPPRSLRPEVPPRLEAIVLTCLEKEPERRFPSARALGAALSALGRDVAPGQDTTQPASLRTSAPGGPRTSAPGGLSEHGQTTLHLGTSTVSGSHPGTPVSLPAATEGEPGVRGHVPLRRGRVALVATAMIVTAGTGIALRWNRLSGSAGAGHEEPAAAPPSITVTPMLAGAASAEAALGLPGTALLFPEEAPPPPAVGAPRRKATSPRAPEAPAHGSAPVAVGPPAAASSTATTTATTGTSTPSPSTGTATPSTTSTATATTTTTATATPAPGAAGDYEESRR